MAKNPKAKSRDNSLFGATLFFLAACLAEAYLLFLRRYYIHGKVVTEALPWHERLKYCIAAGFVVLVLGVVLSVMWKEDKRKRLIGWCLAAAGVFFGFGSLLIRMYQEPALMLLSVVVPVVMVLTVLWAFYDRECSVAMTMLTTSMVVVWVCRRLFANLTLGMPAKALSVVYVLLLCGICYLAKNGKLDKLLSANADLLPIYGVTGVSAAAIVVALFSASAAYYALWALGIVLFALAVYYTVQQL